MQNQRKIVFFNGPPRCGKDTAANLVAGKTMGAPMSFAVPLKRQTAALLGVDLVTLEIIKDMPHAALKGGTPRQYMINLSEKMIKPCYGDDFFGHVAVDSIRKQEPSLSPLVLFSDSGFLSEAIPVVNEFGIENCTLIQIARNGCDFSNDSRSYWNMDGLRTQMFINDGSIKEYLSVLLQYLASIEFI